MRLRPYFLDQIINITFAWKAIHPAKPFCQTILSYGSKLFSPLTSAHWTSGFAMIGIIGIQGRYRSSPKIEFHLVAYASTVQHNERRSAIPFSLIQKLQGPKIPFSFDNDTPALQFSCSTVPTVLTLPSTSLTNAEWYVVQLSRYSLYGSSVKRLSGLLATDAKDTFFAVAVHTWAKPRSMFSLALISSWKRWNRANSSASFAGALATLAAGAGAGGWCRRCHGSLLSISKRQPQNVIAFVQ